jgi:AraC-like DNA-binding protein
MGQSTETLIRPSANRYMPESMPGEAILPVRQSPGFSLPPAFAGRDDVPDEAADAPVPLVGVVIKLLDRAAAAVDSDRMAAKDCIARATALLQAEQNRGDRGCNGTNGRFARGGLTPWQVRQVTRHIDQAMATNISTEDCAAIARLSTSHFRRAFKASFDETFYAWLSRKRVERAQEMMVMTDEPLCRIARQCGFADQSHFTRVFRRLVGPSPGSWRRL